METNENILSLQSILSCDNLSVGVTDELNLMLRREKEKKVKKLHKYSISGPHKSGNRTLYKTRAPWLPSKTLNRNNYNDLIDALYDHYKQSFHLDPSVQQIFEQMIDEYEKDGILTNLTLAHYKADWNKHMVESGCEWLDKPIKDVLPGQIYDYYRHLTAGGKMKRSTFNNLKSVVNAVFNYAYNHNIPCTKASLVDTRRKR